MMLNPHRAKSKGDLGRKCGSKELPFILQTMGVSNMMRRSSFGGLQRTG